MEARLWRFCGFYPDFSEKIEKTMEILKMNLVKEMI